MNVEFHDTLTDEQIRELHELYQTEWWTEGRELEDIRRMLDHSDEHIALIDAESDTLIGFSRVLTDYVYKALVFDVIVANSCRNQKLGQELMKAVVNHPALEAVEHIELYCVSELVPFYEQWRFTDELDDLRLMRRSMS